MVDSQPMIVSLLSEMAEAAFSLATAWELPAASVRVFFVVTLYELGADRVAEKVSVTNPVMFAFCSASSFILGRPLCFGFSKCIQTIVNKIDSQQTF